VADKATNCSFAGVASSGEGTESRSGTAVSPRADVYFSADIETDGPIPGPYSLLSFAIVYAGRFAEGSFQRPANLDTVFYKELRPISDRYEPEALQVNQLDRDRLIREGADPADAMTEAARWIRSMAGDGQPVLVAFPLSFDWTWLYWYLTNFSREGSPFGHSSCFDIKTAFAVKGRVAIADAGRSKLPFELQSGLPHTHNAIDDAREQAEVFAKVMEW
jgi:hypothetical protein